MKQTFLFYILACMTSLFIFTSCEENTDQVIKTQPDNTKEITNRTIDDCNECPNEHCCCIIELVEGTLATLVLCGAYDGMTTTPCGPFSPGSPCSTISGLTAMVSLTSVPDRQLFCVPIGGSFRILNTGGEVKIKITCQHDQIDPDFHIIKLENLDEAYFVSDRDCFLLGCP